jgi:hypothetical protein
MYLSIMHFKWTNVVCLSMDMLIFLMMDVVIISAKLMCRLCFVCKLNIYLVHTCVTVVLQRHFKTNDPMLGF